MPVNRIDSIRCKRYEIKRFTMQILNPVEARVHWIRMLYFQHEISSLCFESKLLTKIWCSLRFSSEDILRNSLVQTEKQKWSTKFFFQTLLHWKQAKLHQSVLVCRLPTLHTTLFEKGASDLASCWILPRWIKIARTIGDLQNLSKESFEKTVFRTTATIR